VKFEHKTWWVRFTNGEAFCYEGPEAEVRTRAEAAGKGAVQSIQTLPYPAMPRTEPKSECPAFCYRPNECAGRTACPRNPCCVD
jgi:hypothetical protein